MMKELSKKWGNKNPYYKLHPIETKIIFESQIQESTFIEKDILEELNERQKVAIEYFKIHQKISRSQYAKLTNCSLRTAFRDLEKLLKDNILIRKGVGRNIYYELARKWHANGTQMAV